MAPELYLIIVIIPLVIIHICIVMMTPDDDDKDDKKNRIFKIMDDKKDCQHLWSLAEREITTGLDSYRCSTCGAKSLQESPY